MEHDFILHAIMKTYVVENSNIVKYLLRILLKMIDEAKVAVDKLVDNGITSTIRDALSQTKYIE